MQGNVEGLVADELKLELVKNHVKADPKNGYVTSVPGIYAVGDVIGPPWLAHVAHHEASAASSALRLRRPHDRLHQYPRLHLHRPRRRQRRAHREGRQGSRARGAHWQVPIPFSGRALASDETEGFVKLVFDAKFGELLGAHLIGSQATEMIAELVMAKKLEATEEEIIHAMHPHPTYSEAIMEAAGQGIGQSIHI